MSSASELVVPNGILLVDKPKGITSHGVISKVRKACGLKRVGHAGTLDPMATGLLLLGLGASTRLLTFLVGLDKEYVATIRLGASSTTDDAEGDLLGFASAEQLNRLTEEDIVTAMESLTGTIMQVPSSVSAIKVDGKRAYARVREGEQVELAAREVTVSSCEVTNINRQHIASGVDAPVIDVEVTINCSSGTYIRAIARDVGFKLGVGGHLTALRRSRVGPFHVTDAVRLDELTSSDSPLSYLRSPSAIARTLFATLDLTDEQARDLSNGKQLVVSGRADSSVPIAGIDATGRLIGLVTVSNEIARTIVNFPQD